MVFSIKAWANRMHNLWSCCDVHIHVPGIEQGVDARGKCEDLLVGLRELGFGARSIMDLLYMYSLLRYSFVHGPLGYLIL